MKRPKATPEEAESLRMETLRVISLAPISLTGLRDHHKTSQRRVEHWLFTLRKGGLIVSALTAQGTRLWCVPWHLAGIQAERERVEAMRRESKARHATMVAERQAKKQRALDVLIARDEAAGHDDARQVRYVPAASVRAHVAGPRWVFDLGRATPGIL